MKALSSSRLRLLEERCGHALDLAEDNAPQDAEVFAVGKVAHACLDALHGACKRAGRPLTPPEASEVAHATAALMATRGSRFDGAPEPPVPVAAMRPGVDLALGHFAVEGMALAPDAHPELGLGVDSEWRPMPYATATHWRGVLDLIGLHEDYDGALVLWVRDYKSAWSAGPATVQSLQMRGQALLALAHFDRLFPDSRPPDVIRREVVNLRTSVVHAEDLDLADAEHIFDGWRAEIDAIVRAVPKRPRPARPGPQCAGCTYRRICTAAPPDAVDLPATARRYAALLAEARALEPTLRAATEEEPLRVDGHVLGWRVGTRAEPAAGAHQRLAALFTPDPDPRLVGLVSHLIGVSGIRSAVEALHPDGRSVEARDALLSDLITHRSRAEWTFVRAADPERKEKV